MDLIGKNKVIEYLKVYPELKNDFLFWLERFSELEEGRCLPMISFYKSRKMKESEWRFGIAEWRLGYTDYWICGNTNIWLKTSCIMWIGTAEELEIYINNAPEVHIQSHQHASEYENNLNNAISIFGAMPKQPEYSELVKLVESIKMHERTYLPTWLVNA